MYAYLNACMIVSLCVCVFVCVCERERGGHILNYVRSMCMHDFSVQDNIKNLICAGVFMNVCV